jgi:DNA repair protein RadC
MLEQFKVLLLNRANKVIEVYEASSGELQEL